MTAAQQAPQAQDSSGSEMNNGIGGIRLILTSTNPATHRELVKVNLADLA